MSASNVRVFVIAVFIFACIPPIYFLVNSAKTQPLICPDCPNLTCPPFPVLHCPQCPQCPSLTCGGDDNVEPTEIQNTTPSTPIIARDHPSRSKMPGFNPGRVPPPSRVHPETNRSPRVLIAIPTVPRKDHLYLTRVLESYDRELRSLDGSYLSGKTTVLVFNQHPEGHPEFDALKTKYESQASFVFAENTWGYVDKENVADPDDRNNPSNRPGRKVRQQGRDIITLLEYTSNWADFVLVVEDDFVPCPGTLKIIHGALDKADASFPSAIFGHLGYGFNGVLLSNDLIRAAGELLVENIMVLPCDLIMNWKMKDVPGTNVFSFGSVLWVHFGKSSSLRETGLAMNQIPTCYQPNRFGSNVRGCSGMCSLPAQSGFAAHKGNFHFDFVGGHPSIVLEGTQGKIPLTTPEDDNEVQRIKSELADLVKGRA